MCLVCFLFLFDAPNCFVFKQVPNKFVFLPPDSCKVRRRLQKLRPKARQLQKIISRLAQLADREFASENVVSYLGVWRVHAPKCDEEIRVIRSGRFLELNIVPLSLPVLQRVREPGVQFGELNLTISRSVRCVLTHRYGSRF